MLPQKGGTFCRIICTTIRRVYLSREFNIITDVNKLLALLAEYEEYSTIQHIAEKSLHIENGNPVPYYWLIVSYRRLGAASVAEDFLKRGEEHLELADYQELLDRLDGKIDSFTVENA